MQKFFVRSIIWCVLHSLAELYIVCMNILTLIDSNNLYSYCTFVWVGPNMAMYFSEILAKLTAGAFSHSKPNLYGNILCPTTY